MKSFIIKLLVKRLRKRFGGGTLQMLIDVKNDCAFMNGDKTENISKTDYYDMVKNLVASYGVDDPRVISMECGETMEVKIYYQSNGENLIKTITL